MAHVDVAAIPSTWHPSDATLVDALLHDQPMQRERWKYTRQDKVLALVDKLAAGNKQQTASDALGSSSEAAFPDLARLLAETPAAVHALSQLGVFEESCLQDKEGLTLPETSVQAMRITVSEGCTAELNESFAKNQPHCRLLWIDLAEGARLTHSRNLFSPAQQWHYLHVTIGKHASYQLHNHALGGELLRQDILLDLIAPGGHADLTGSAIVGAARHLDQQIRVQHLAPHATSDQNIHTIAEDRAKVTFGGRIHIHPGCDGTDAQLQNKNLALSDNVTINTKPELEIYAEDVKCAHGATVGRLDDTSAFYCHSRGIDPGDARTLLSRAFIRTATLGPLAEAALDAYERALS